MLTLISQYPQLFIGLVVGVGAIVLPLVLWFFLKKTKESRAQRRWWKAVRRGKVRRANRIRESMGSEWKPEVPALVGLKIVGFTIYPDDYGRPGGSDSQYVGLDLRGLWLGPIVGCELDADLEGAEFTRQVVGVDFGRAVKGWRSRLEHGRVIREPIYIQAEDIPGATGCRFRSAE